MKKKQSKKTVLVTGGAGFIGAHVAKKLSDMGYRVISVDNFNEYYDPSLKKDRVKHLLKDYDIPFYTHNIADIQNLRKIFKKHKIDAICHLAAQAGVRYSLENPFVYIESNISGTLNLLELAKEFNVKSFVFASSSSVYGERDKSPFFEDDKTDEPISLYAATKKATELMAHKYSKIYGINATGLRFFTVYGPWARPDMALYKFTRSILEGKPVEIYNYGKMKRDFTYIDDIVDGVVKAIEKNYKWEIINLSSGSPVELLEFVNILESAIGKEAKKVLKPLQPGDVLKTYGSIAKAKKLLDFKPKMTIEQGVKKFVEWYMGYYGKVLGSPKKKPSKKKL